MEIIKIGIITFHRAHNYGAVLQAYALLTALKSMGHTAEIIDYWPEYRKGHYSLFSVKSPVDKKTPASQLKKIIKEILSFPLKLNKSLKFNRFILNELKIKGKPFPFGRQIENKYDVIICGSDQIWRYNFRDSGGFDDVYFGKYPVNKNIIKISYAASMGDQDIDDSAKKILEKLLRKPDFISVREDSLLELVKPLTKKIVTKVLDPVFLLPVNEWTTIIRKNSIKKKYLLFYQLLQNEEAADLSKKIAKERQLELIEIRGQVVNTNPFTSINLKLSSGPIDFISLIAHADYVVSTSYHGVAFSILFNKIFSTLKGINDNCYRIKSLLQSLGIENCLLDKNSYDYPTFIDYTFVNARLNEMKKQSLSFLNTSINKRKHLEETVTSNQ